MQITADISKILENIQRGLIFIFDVLSESRIGFVSFLVFLALENVVSFTNIVFIENHKHRFYRKRISVTMRNYVMCIHFTPTLATVWHKIF